jgi:hypothetical protein
MVIITSTKQPKTMAVKKNHRKGNRERIKEKKEGKLI